MTKSIVNLYQSKKCINTRANPDRNKVHGYQSSFLRAELLYELVCTSGTLKLNNKIIY